MATELFPGVFVQQPDADPAPNTAFTVWNDAIAGANITTLLTAVDGITPYEATTDAEGNILPFRGPDGYQGPAFVDTGASIRYMLLSSSVWNSILTDLGSTIRTNQNLTWTGIQNFTVPPLVPDGSFTISDTAGLQAAIDAAASTGGGGTGGVTDHGLLSGLTDDDHPQYHNDARGDIRYYPRASVDSAISTAVAANSTADRNRANHTGTQSIGSITNLQTALDAQVDIAHAMAGSRITLIWDASISVWRTVAGVSVSARPGARNDVLLDLIGGADSSRPVWANQPGDTHEVTVTP